VRKLTFIVATLVVAVFANPALATWTAKPTKHRLNSYSFVKKQYVNAINVLLWFKNHPKVGTPRGRAQVIRAHQWLRAWSAERMAVLYYAMFPPHHALWMCIHGDPKYGSHVGNEASSWKNHDTGDNGHYGGLQMYPGWLNMFRGTADQYSQLQQEWFAEKAYRQNRYRQSWLTGQWGQTISPCWQHAE
jgi:hypothetical protein